MCFSANMSLGLGIVGFAASGMTFMDKNETLPVRAARAFAIFHFSLMELIQYFAYPVAGQCGYGTNRLLSELSTYHIALQSFAIMPALATYSTDPAALKRATVAGAIMSGSFILFSFMPKEIQLSGIEPNFIGNMISCLYMGTYHIAYSIQSALGLLVTWGSLFALALSAFVWDHHQEGGAERAAAVSTVPIVNAGDGTGGQHPTQALLDVYTIYDECKTIDGISVALIGALDSGRTARPLAYLLSKFERVRLYFVAPDEMQIKRDILDHLDEHDVWYHCTSNPAEALPHVDVVYQTRIDRERLRQSAISSEQYTLNSTVLASMKPNSIIMHPLPRSVEIDSDVDRDPRAAYFRQARNGLFVRMA